MRQLEIDATRARRRAEVEQDKFDRNWQPKLTPDQIQFLADRRVVERETRQRLKAEREAFAPTSWKIRRKRIKALAKTKTS